MKIKSFLYSVVLFLLGSCNNRTNTSYVVEVDSISVKQFLNGGQLCHVALAKGFHEIKPEMEAWATNPIDTFVESYIINGKRLTISQPLKRPEYFQDSARHYTYDMKTFKTIRVLIDSLPFNFNDVTFDYGGFPLNVFQNDTAVLFKNQPLGWCGLANRYKFIQLFDLRKMICFEMFVDEYSCLPEDPLKGR